MYDKIPVELKAEKAWVNVWNKGKVPMRSIPDETGKLKAASPSDPTTWSTFEEAVDAWNHNIFDGIGYVFHDTGLVGIDIDDGFDESGLLTPLAADIMAHCQSYTEVSRSGRGVHILLKGDLPFEGRNNRAGVEIYKNRRYFITTGRVLIYPEIEDNTAAVDYVVKTYFQEMTSDNEIPSLTRIYSPMYEKPFGGKVFVRPTYPPIGEGGRNISLTSLAGLMHNTGYSSEVIHNELIYANSVACDPPLPEDEIDTIVRSVTRYQR